jgi:hypothetical protein
MKKTSYKYNLTRAIGSGIEGVLKPARYEGGLSHRRVSRIRGNSRLSWLACNPCIVCPKAMTHIA